MTTFENEPQELLAVLENLRQSKEYISENIEELTSFANSISGLYHYYNPKNPRPMDRYTAILIYNALLENAMRIPYSTEAQIIYTRDLAMCLSYTVGTSLGHKAIEYINRLFEKISIQGCAELSPKARDAYPFCKFVWMGNHFNNIDNDFETLEVIYDEMKDFTREARECLPEYNWDNLEQMIFGSRMVLGTRCEFGGSITMSGNSAQKQLLFMQQGLNQEAWAAFAPENNIINDDNRIEFLRNHDLPEKDSHDTYHLAWAELAYRCKIIDNEEYWRFLFELAKKTIAKPPVEAEANILLIRLQTGLSATAVLCKYYDSMPNSIKLKCGKYAQQCLQWFKSFPEKGRMILGQLGNELNTVLTIALMGLSKREKALNILQLFTESVRGHSILCAEKAVDLAKSLLETDPEAFSEIFPGLTTEQILDEIYTGALLHDIGKLEITAPISPEIRSAFNKEFGQLKTHPTRSLKYLSAPEFACARACALWHHEYEKGGHPLGYEDTEAERFRPIAQLISKAHS